MVEIDVTQQCVPRYDISRDGEALIYLLHNDTPIGLFDRNGLHFMSGAEETYRFEDGFKAHGGIIWFKVYERR